MDPSLVTLTLRLCALQGAVQVKLELGHRAQVRKKPTVEGFTHDWMVFVRGPEHSNIQHFVEKVVFHLHESFPKPKRGEESCPGALCGGGGVKGSTSVIDQTHTHTVCVCIYICILLMCVVSSCACIYFTAAVQCWQSQVLTESPFCHVVCTMLRPGVVSLFMF